METLYLKPTLAKSSAIHAVVSRLTKQRLRMQTSLEDGASARSTVLHIVPAAAGPAPTPALSCVALLSLSLRNVSRLAEKSHLRGGLLGCRNVTR